MDLTRRSFLGLLGFGAIAGPAVPELLAKDKGFI